MEVEIDGSILEGGGQILRMSVAFSAIMNKPVKISKIRLGRSKPGLAAQHLTGLQMVAKMCGAKLTGAHIGSTEIRFVPGVITGGQYQADTKTAGSISLLLQVALPFALLADKSVILDLRGGTNADMAPQIEYMTEVFRPVLKKFGGSFDLDLRRRGYYPKGGGCVIVNIKPVKQFDSVNLTNIGKVNKVIGWSFVSGTIPLKLTTVASNSAKQELRTICDHINIECYKEQQEIAPYNCNGIVLVCQTSTGCTIGGSALGSRIVGPTEIGEKAAREIISTVQHGACLDQFAQDQVILYMALARGSSSFSVGEISLHTQTAIYIAQKFTQVKFYITQMGPRSTIECSGIGYVNKNIP